MVNLSQFGRDLASLGFSTYAEYLNSWLWFNIRERAFGKHGKACKGCREPATEIHHWSYDIETLRGETISYLVPICHECHHKIEFFEDGTKRSVEAANEVLQGLEAAWSNPGPEEKPYEWMTRKEKVAYTKAWNARQTAPQLGT